MMKLLRRIFLKLKFEFKKINRNTNRKRAIKVQNQIKNNTKYFCIGRNKTGTTSLKKAFEELGFVVGNQRQAELLMENYFNGDFEKLIKYCKKAEVFQDVPFSLPETYKVLDNVYPNSKFILTIRDDSDQWYNSLTKFHSKIFGNHSIPTRDLLQEADYVYQGWMYNNFVRIYGINEQDELYDKAKLTSHYTNHNNQIIEYFKDRPQDLLIINLSEKNSYRKFCEFIGVESKRDTFPWENKTS